NAARHLAPGGVFVVECRIPAAPARPYRQFVDAEHVAADAVMLGVCQYDPVTQVLDLNHVRISADGIVLMPISLRLAHPPEFELTAWVAGRGLRGRWGGWSAEPYTATSWRHVSVYEPALELSCRLRPDIRAKLDTIIPIVVGAPLNAPS